MSDFFKCKKFTCSW